MRKLYLIEASLVALVVSLGISAQALAAPKYDPDCVALDHQFKVFDFGLSFDETAELVVSGFSGLGLACGSVIDGSAGSPYVGVGTINDRADVSIAPGVQVNRTGTADVPEGSYIGHGQIDILSFLAEGRATLFVDDVDFDMRADTDPAADCPSGAIACYRGDVDDEISGLQGHAWVWVTGSEAEADTLTIGRFHNTTPFADGEPTGLTEIETFDVCSYAGAVGTTSCGDGSDGAKWLQKNGDWSREPMITTPFYVKQGRKRCGLGYGVYSVTVTNRSGVTTPASSVCVDWRPTRKVLPVGVKTG